MVVMGTGRDGTGPGLGPVPYRSVEGWSRRDMGLQQPELLAITKGSQIGDSSRITQCTPGSGCVSVFSMEIKTLLIDSERQLWPPHRL
jgi:hypothetical protein